VTLNDSSSLETKVVVKDLSIIRNIEDVGVQ